MPVCGNGHRKGGEPDPRTEAEDPFTALGLKGTSLWVPSQNGCTADRPQRHSALTLRRVDTSLPCSSSRRSGPRTSRGPSDVTRTMVISSFRVIRSPDLDLAFGSLLVLDAEPGCRTSGQSRRADRLAAGFTDPVAAVGQASLGVLDVGQLGVEVLDDREVSGPLEHL